MNIDLSCPFCGAVANRRIEGMTLVVSCTACRQEAARSILSEIMDDKTTYIYKINNLDKIGDLKIKLICDIFKISKIEFIKICKNKNFITFECNAYGVKSVEKKLKKANIELDIFPPYIWFDGPQRETTSFPPK